MMPLANIGVGNDDEDIDKVNAQAQGQTQPLPVLPPMTAQPPAAPPQQPAATLPNVTGIGRGLTDIGAALAPVPAAPQRHLMDAGKMEPAAPAAPPRPKYGDVYSETLSQISKDIPWYAMGRKSRAQDAAARYASDVTGPQAEIARLNSQLGYRKEDETERSHAANENLRGGAAKMTHEDRVARIKEMHEEAIRNHDDKGAALAEQMFDNEFKRGALAEDVESRRIGAGARLDKNQIGLANAATARALAEAGIDKMTADKVLARQMALHSGTIDAGPEEVPNAILPVYGQKVGEALGFMNPSRKLQQERTAGAATLPSLTPVPKTFGGVGAPAGAPAVDASLKAKAKRPGAPPRGAARGPLAPDLGAAPIMDLPAPSPGAEQIGAPTAPAIAPPRAGAPVMPTQQPAEPPPPRQDINGDNEAVLINSGMPQQDARELIRLSNEGSPDEQATAKKIIQKRRAKLKAK